VGIRGGTSALLLEAILVDDIRTHVADNSSSLLFKSTLDSRGNLALKIVHNIVVLIIRLVIAHVHGGIIDGLVHLILKVHPVALGYTMISKSALDSYSSEFLSLVLLLMGTRS
jgi:hypothetical protein